MTRATYNTDNTITEQSEIEKPHHYNYPSGLTHKQAVERYEKHLSTLRTLVCSPECRGLWKPGQVLVEGVHYRVVAAFLADGGGLEEYFAFPLPVKSEDDLWYKAIDLIMVAHDKGLSKEDAISVVKSQFIITKR